MKYISYSNECFLLISEKIGFLPSHIYSNSSIIKYVYVRSVCDRNVFSYNKNAMSMCLPYNSSIFFTLGNKQIFIYRISANLLWYTFPFLFFSFLGFIVAKNPFFPLFYNKYSEYTNAMHSTISNTKRMLPFLFYDSYFLDTLDISCSISFNIIFGSKIYHYNSFLLFLLTSFLGIIYFMQIRKVI